MDSSEACVVLKASPCADANELATDACLCPVTPDSNKENGDFALDLSSPLTVVKKLPKVLPFSSRSGKKEDLFACIDGSSSPQTPEDSVFDPFAPAAEDWAMAPLRKKYFDEVWNRVARPLNFTSSIRSLGDAFDDAESVSDEEMFESVYENLLEAIVSNQTEGALAEISNLHWDSDSCRTPPGPRLTGIAETCPGAPLRKKPAAKLRMIDMGLSRKLEF